MRDPLRPESWQWGSGSLVLGVGWVVEIGGRVSECAHPFDKSGLGAQIQAYIASFLSKHVIGASSLELARVGG